MGRKTKDEKEQIANVPDPPVPNRAHTEMKKAMDNARCGKKVKCDDDKCEIVFDKKKN